MGYNYLFLIFIFIIAFIQTPKPENIQIFNIDDNSDKKGPYEINVLKNEIFLDYNLQEEEELIAIGVTQIILF